MIKTTSAIALICLLSSIVLTGCTDNKKNKVESTTGSLNSGQGSVAVGSGSKEKVLGPLASTEYRYSNDEACGKAASAYFNKPDSTGTLDDHILTSSPLTFFFCTTANTDDPNAKEIRFTVKAANPSQPVDTIMYYKVESKTGNHKKDLEQAFRKLIRENKCDSIKGPTEDKYEVNGVKPWRAILKAKDPIDPSTNQFLVNEGDEFGVIINPPFPK